MKKIFNIFYLLAILLVVASCNEDDDTTVIPDQVKDLSATADYGAIILNWALPAGGNIDYINITYTIGDRDFSKNVSKYNLDSISGLVSTTIDGFGDTNEYSFSVASCNTLGGKSEPLTISKAPLPPAYKEVINTISIVPDFGGGIISWTNETGKKLLISVSYSDPANPTAKETITFTSEATGKDYISNLPADPITFEVVVSDLFENSSDPVTFDITPLAESKISKDGWSIPGYDASTSVETIGYSSQSLYDGGGNGYIVNIIDDDINTYWNADWAYGAVYPHWFIVDFGKEITISRLVLTRRQGNNKGHKGQQFLTCNAAGASDPADPTTWQWEDQGEYPFNIEINDPQSYRLPANPKARYLKVYMAPKFKGLNNNTMLAELSVYGKE